MKNSTTCPKCSGTKILRIPGRVLSDGAGNFISAGIFRYARVDRYVCESCGYSEEWIATKDDIEKLKNKYGE
ncbi:MAG: hypothetical protein AAF587_02935 [Bacteroidota bacterium]